MRQCGVGIALMACLLVVASTPVVAQTVRGATPSERIALLAKEASNPSPTPAQKQQIRDHFWQALGDPAPEVRGFAGSVDFDEEYDRRLVKMLTTDPSDSVRQAIAIGMSQLTDGGAESCAGAELVARHLPSFIVALKYPATQVFILDILGVRNSGDTYIPCCFSKSDKASVVRALKSIRDSQVPKAPNSGYAALAIGNIESCRTQTPTAQPMPDGSGTTPLRN